MGLSECFKGGGRGEPRHQLFLSKLAQRSCQNLPVGDNMKVHKKQSFALYACARFLRGGVGAENHHKMFVLFFEVFILNTFFSTNQNTRFRILLDPELDKIVIVGDGLMHRNFMKFTNIFYIQSQDCSSSL